MEYTRRWSFHFRCRKLPNQNITLEFCRENVVCSRILILFTITLSWLTVFYSRSCVEFTMLLSLRLSYTVHVPLLLVFVILTFASSCSAKQGSLLGSTPWHLRSLLSDQAMSKTKLTFKPFNDGPPCADGSPSGIYVEEEPVVGLADSRNHVIVFNGGGACTSPEDCFDGYDIEPTF